MDSKRKERISLVDTYRSLISHITEEHVLFLQIVLAAALGLLILYVLSRRVLRSVSGRSLVLVGGCEAGKTALLYTLAHGDTPLTVTTFKENIASFDTGQKTVRMVDVPGHERVRGSAFDRHKKDARAIVFMLDSATVHSHVRDVAEQLFSILSDSSVQASRCPVAVACNKQDLEIAKAAPVIERALAREIDLLRETSVNRLASTTTGSSNDNNNSIGTAGQPFGFSQLSRNAVTFIETSVTDNSLQQLEDWITKVT